MDVAGLALLKEWVADAAATHADEGDVLAVDDVLAEEHVDGPQVATLDDDGGLAEGAHLGARQVNRQVGEAAAVEDELLGVLRLGDEDRAGEGLAVVAAVADDDADLLLGQQVRGHVAEGATG